MAEHSPLRIAFSGSWYAELIYAYDAAVESTPLRSIVHGAPAAFWFVRRGRIEAEALDGTWRVEGGKGEGFLLPEQSRRHAIARGTRLLSIRFRIGSLQGAHFGAGAAGSRLRKRDAARLCQSGTLVAAALKESFETNSSRMWLTRRADRMELRADLEWRGRFLLWVADLFGLAPRMGWTIPTPDKLPLPLSRFMTAVHASETPRAVLPELVRSSGVSASTLKRLTHAHLGLSPSEIVEKARYERVITLLRDANLPLKHIALELGFSSPAHFSNWFRAIAGCTPTIFREGQEQSA